MKYKAEITLLTRPVENKLLYNLLIWLGGFLFYSFVMYASNYKQGKEDIFIMSELLLLLILVIAIYYEISSKFKAITKTAIQVEILEDKILVSTAPFKFLWIKRLSAILEFKVDQVTIKNVQYPIKSLFSSNDRVLKLNSSGIHAFILIDFFDRNLEGKLNEIENKIN